MTRLGSNGAGISAVRVVSASRFFFLIARDLHRRPSSQFPICFRGPVAPRLGRAPLAKRALPRNFCPSAAAVPTGKASSTSDGSTRQRPWVRLSSEHRAPAALRALTVRTHAASRGVPVARFRMTSPAPASSSSTIQRRTVPILFVFGYANPSDWAAGTTAPSACYASALHR